MSTQLHRERIPCGTVCRPYGEACGREHFIEVVDHNTTCQTTIRKITDGKVEQQMIFEWWPEMEALTRLLRLREKP